MGTKSTGRAGPSMHRHASVLVSVLVPVEDGSVVELAVVVAVDEEEEVSFVGVDVSIVGEEEVLSPRVPVSISFGAPSMSHAHTRSSGPRRRVGFRFISRPFMGLVYNKTKEGEASRPSPSEFMHGTSP